MKINKKAVMQRLILIITFLGWSFSQVATANISEKIEQDELRKFLKETITHADSFDNRFDAEVWLVDMSGRLKRFVKNPKSRLKLLRAVHREASRAELKPDLVLALIEVESHFNEFAISRVGAQGLMQVMPFWKNEIGRPEDNLTDIDTNLSYGCRILQFYLKKEKGNWMNALARYNGSYGQYWYPERVMNAWRKRWFINEA
ncbi:MAG: soluble lytic murein transglycosylase-like protein [Pseudohongiellaceae bacterium]